MMHSASKIKITEVNHADFKVEPWTWKFASELRPEIDRFFVEMQDRGLRLWNGRVLMLRDYAIRDGTLRGSCFETDYASFMAWRDWDFPDPSVFNIFSCSALRGADGGFVAGEMALSTANPGQVSFPSGTPDLSDVLGIGALDVAHNLKRELMEETGLDLDEFDADPGWTVVRDRGFFALMKRVRSQLSADALRERILRNLANDPHPEFTAIRILREPADLDSRMYDYLKTYIRYEWQR